MGASIIQGIRGADSDALTHLTQISETSTLDPKVPPNVKDWPEKWKEYYEEQVSMGMEALELEQAEAERRAEMHVRKEFAQAVSDF